MEGALDAHKLEGRWDEPYFKDLDANRSGALDRNEYAKAVAIGFKGADIDDEYARRARTELPSKIQKWILTPP
jgi:hypothetical protein